MPTLSSYYELEHCAPDGIYKLLAFNERDLSRLASRTVIDHLDLVLSNDQNRQLGILLLNAPDGRLRLRDWRHSDQLMSVGARGIRNGCEQRMKLQLLRDLSLDHPAASGQMHLSAGSGLAVFGDCLYVIGDDELHLAKFSIAGGKPGKLIRLFPGSLPRDAKRRKALKPDLELLVPLPPCSDHPHGALLAMGSGSTNRRMRGALITLDGAGDVATVAQLDLAPLFEAVRAVVGETNLEGAVLLGEGLLLFNRGNTASPGTTVLCTDPSFIHGGGRAAVRFRKRLDIGAVDGVPLGVTDACALGGDTVLVSAVAEDTPNAYDDGRLVGAAIVILDPDLTIRHFEPIEPAVKIEGLHAWRTEDAIRVLAVTDADDPEIPSRLFSGSIPEPGARST